MNQRLLDRTIDIAKAMCPLNVELRCSHIAFLIKKNKICHIGMNIGKTHPRVLKYNYKGGSNSNIHAELRVCIKSGKENLKEFTMVVLRVDRNGKLSNSKPCNGCTQLIRQFSVGEIWFSDKNGQILKLNYEN